jgi:uncharacterized heparinase superfamily protein
VNWIKWALNGNRLKEEWLESLALQARWLRRRLEYHLLANHLLANAKALVYAGAFFEGEEAGEWLDKGLEILEKEMPEQILSDGGHFERSPMYHSIVLEDVLDLVNLFGGVGDGSADRGEVGQRIALVARKAASHSGNMLAFLEGMCHPDGDISFFNDAAFGMAAEPMALVEYAERLGIEVPASQEDGLTHFVETGYVRYQDGPLAAILDVAPVGPDYQPGHAHADTLSFELSLFGQRLFVNSGTSTYEVDEERQRQRSTRAHNTVEIDGENSSEVWKSFRVARRAYPRNLDILEAGDQVRVSCEHDGYRRLRGRPVHQREWKFAERRLTITDRVTRKPRMISLPGSRATLAPTGGCLASFHLHPEVEVIQEARSNRFLLRLASGEEVRFSLDGGETWVEDSTWHPEFGLSIPNKVIRCRFDVRLESRSSW